MTLEDIQIKQTIYYKMNQSISSAWNSHRPISFIEDPRKLPIGRPPLSVKSPTSPKSPNHRKYRPVSPVSFSVSPSDLVIPDQKRYECESVFEPISTKVFSAIPNVLSRWNEQPSLNKITFEWKKKIYQLLRKNETKVSQSQTYHKVYILEKEYKDITSPNGICIKAEEWKEISSFYIKIYDENLPYNGEFYL